MVISKRAEPTLLTDQVYSVIHEAIMNGSLPAGARLRVRDLAEQVGTSVMPVREAIRRLEETGLAERVPHKGAVVRRLTLTELVHVYGVRQLLEVEAARLGAQRITQDECDAMQREYDVMLAATEEGNAVSHIDHDEAMLSVLYNAGGNPVLVQTISNLWNRCRAYKIFGVQGALDSNDAETLWRYQQELLAAARRNDDVAAAAINDQSLSAATERINALLATQSVVG